MLGTITVLLNCENACFFIFQEFDLKCGLAWVPHIWNFSDKSVITLFQLVSIELTLLVMSNGKKELGNALYINRTASCWLHLGHILRACSTFV